MWCAILLFGAAASGQLAITPRRIIQTAPTDVRDDWVQWTAKLAEMNPGFEMQLYNDDSALAFVETHFNESSSQLRHAYRYFVKERVVMAADLFRLAAVGAIGGFYMDMDMLAKSSFEPLTTAAASFPLEWWKDDNAFSERHFRLPLDEEEHWQVGNYAFGAQAGNAFVMDALSEALRRCRDLEGLGRPITDLEVLRTTGPYMLSEVFHDGRRRGLYGDVQLLRGDDQPSAKPRSHGGDDWHKFGPYAEHMLAHSWVQSRALEEYEEYSQPSPAPSLAPCELVEVPSPPQLTQVKFSSTGAQIHAYLSPRSDRGGVIAGATFACDEVLSFDEASLAECYWVDGAEIVATVSDSLSFTARDNVMLLAQLVKVKCVAGARCDCYDYADESSTVALPPDEPLVPVAVLAGATTVAICEVAGLSVSGEQSTGSGGREMRFVWSAFGVFSEGAVSTEEEIAFADEVLAEAVRQSNEGVYGVQFFAVSSAALQNISTGGYSAVSVQLSLTNFLDFRSVSKDFVVELSSEEIPSLEVLGGTERSFKRANAISIEAAGSATSCTGRAIADRSLEYTWVLSERAEDSTGPFTVTSLRTTSVNPRYFKLAAYSLESHVAYQLVVTAVDDGGSVKTNNTALVSIELETGAVVASVDGGSLRTFSTSQYVELSAESSYDADVADGLTSGLSFEWNCDSDACGAVALETAAEDVLEFEAARLGVGTYVFSVVVTASDGRAATASVTVSIVEGAVPSISISRASRNPRLNNAVKQRVMGDIDITDSTLGRSVEVTSTWSLLAGDLAGGAELEDAARTALTYATQVDASTTLEFLQHDLVISQYALVPGGVYSFMLEARVGASETAGVSVITVEVSTPPSSGEFLVSPGEGEAVTTKFELTSASWVSEELPLRYLFSVDGTILRAYAVDLSYVTTLPPGAPNVTLATRAQDAIGGSSSVSRSVRVTASTLVGDALTGAASLALADAFALDSLDSICSIVTATTAAAENETSALDLLVSSLSDAVGIYLDIDSTLVEQTTRTLSGPVAHTASLSLDAAVLALDLVASLSSTLVEAGLGDGESTTAGSTATVVSDLLNKQELFGQDESVYADARARARRRLAGRRLAAVDDSSQNNTATNESTSELVMRTIDQLARAQLDTLIAGEDAVGVDSPNLGSSNQRVASDWGGAASLTQPYMNSSANFTPALGSSYAAQLSEIPLDASPHAASDDANAAIATSATVRFGLGALSDDARRRRRHSKARRLEEAVKDTISPATLRVSLSIPEPSEDVLRARPVSNASHRMNLTCKCTDGVPYDLKATCPDNSTVTHNCSGYAGGYQVTCPSRRGGCAVWDGLNWVTPPNCVSRPRADGSTTCVCDVPVKAEAFDISTADALANAAENYVSNLAEPLDPAKAIYMFIAFGALLVLGAVMWIYGTCLDKRDAATVLKHDAESDEIKREIIRRTSSEFLFTAPSETALDRFTNASFLARCKRALFMNHSFVSYVVVYAKTVPRKLRGVMVCYEILTFMFCVAIETNLSYPDPGCGDKLGKVECEESTKTAKIGPSLLAAVWDSDARRHLLEPVCEWKFCSKSCEVIGAKGNDTTTPHHYMMLALVFLIALPLVTLLEVIFENYLIAPVPREVAAFFSRGRSVDPTGELEGGAPIAAESEMDSEVDSEVDSRGFPAQSLFHDSSAVSSAVDLERATSDQDVVLEESIAVVHSVGECRLARVESINLSVSDSLEMLAVVKAREKEEEEEEEFIGGFLNTAKSVKKVVQCVNLKPVLFDADHTDRILTDLSVTPLPYDETPGKKRSNFTRPQLVSSRSSVARTAFPTIAAAAASVRRRGRSRGGALEKSVRKALEAYADKVAPSVAQGVLDQRAELKACEVRYAERFAASGDETHEAVTGHARAVRYLARLDAVLCRAWDYKEDSEVFVGNVRTIVLRDMLIAEAWHGELVELEASSETALEYAASARELFVQWVRLSQFNEQERTVLNRSAEKIESAEPEAPEESPRARDWCLALALFLCVTGIYAYYLLTTASQLGKKESIKWLQTCLIAAIMYFVFVAPLAILFFYVIIPSAITEHFSHVQDPTKIPLFPYQTKVPQGAAFYLVKGHPNLANTPTGRISLGITDLHQDEALDQLPSIHRHLTWRPSLTSRLMTLFIASAMIMPDFLLEMIFEEIFTLLPLFSIMVTPKFFGDPSRRGGDLGSLLVFGFSIAVLAVLTALTWVTYGAINGFEKAAGKVQRELDEANIRQFLSFQGNL